MMNLTQVQVSAIRRLVEAARDKSASYEGCCNECYYDTNNDRQECDGLTQIDDLPDVDALEAAALAVELDVLDKLPTLPSEIEALP